MIAEKNSLLSQIEESTRALKDAFRKNDDDFQSSREELREQNVSIDRLRTTSVDLKLTKERTENELWRTQRELAHLGELISMHHDEMVLLKERLNDCKSRNNTLCEDLEELETSNEKLVEDLDILNGQHDEAIEELSASREWNEKLCEQFLEAEMKSQELAKELDMMAEQHKHCSVIRGSLEHKKKEVVVRREQLDNLKSRDERVTMLLVNLANSIKGQVKKPKNESKNCILYPLKQIVPLKRRKSAPSRHAATIVMNSFKLKEPFGMVQEILDEFVPQTSS